MAASSAIFPLTVSRDVMIIDIPVMAVVTVTALVFFIRKKGLQKGGALTLLVMYGAYLILRVFII